ncbi:T9SS type A sorting domain-containing protein, partial [bacterium]|nr:T9SS type A sorting domain-containing protein [bacterium]
PNPFNPEVVLSFTAPRDVRAVVEIYDVRGAKVRTLLDARVDAGPHTATWDGRDDGGTARASGVYFARVKVGEETRVEKLALIR